MSPLHVRLLLLAILAVVAGASAVRGAAAQGENESSTASEPGAIGGRTRFELEMASKLLADGLPARAEEPLRRVVRDAPEHPAGWLLLSRALLDQGKTAEAVDAARKALALVAALPAQGRSPVAEAAFHAQLGESLAATADWPGAASALSRAALLRPDDGRLRQRLGAALLQVGRDAEAAEQLERATTLLPSSPPAWLDLGRARLRRGDAAGSVAAVKKSLELAPDDPDAHYALSSAQRALGDFDAADAELAQFEKLKAAAEARRADLERIEAQLRDSTAKLAEDDCDGARPILEKLLADPVAAESVHSQRVMVDLAHCRQRGGDVAGALALYRDAARRRPGTFLPEFELGTLLASEGRLDDALPHLLRAAAAQPFEPRAHVNLGLSYGALGRLNDAVAEMRKAVMLDPHDASTRQLLANLEWSVGNQAHARALVALGGITEPAADAAPQRPAADPVPAGTRRDPAARSKIPWAR